MNTHAKCPHCDERGQAITGQDKEVLACDNPACRVFAYARYYG